MASVSVPKLNTFDSLEQEKHQSNMDLFIKKFSSQLTSGIQRIIGVIDLEKLAQGTNRLASFAYKPMIYGTIILGTLSVTSEKVSAQYGTRLVEVSLSSISLRTDRPNNESSRDGFGVGAGVRGQADDSHLGWKAGAGYKKFNTKDAENFYVNAKIIEGEVGGYLSSKDGIDEGFSFMVEGSLVGSGTFGTSNYRDRNGEQDYENWDIGLKGGLGMFYTSYAQTFTVGASASYQKNLLTDGLDNRSGGNGLGIRGGNDGIVSFNIFVGIPLSN